jgi:septal ring factor EnvC (AmiA/AmiB activator)
MQTEQIEATTTATPSVIARICERYNVHAVVQQMMEQAAEHNREIVTAQQAEISRLKFAVAEEKTRVIRLQAEVREHELRWAELEASPAVRMVPVTGEPNFEGDGD